MPIRFKFMPEKAVAALTYLARRVDDLTAMKAVKLLFFADRAHLLKYGRPIIGDVYYGMEHGPVPTATYELIKNVFASRIDAETERAAELLARYLDIDRSGDYPRFVKKADPDMDFLSASDVEILDATLDEHGATSAEDLSKLAHQQPEVQYADEQRALQHRGSIPIPFSLFFAREKDRAMLTAVERTQEERDFEESVRW